MVVNCTIKEPGNDISRFFYMFVLSNTTALVN